VEAGTESSMLPGPSARAWYVVAFALSGCWIIYIVIAVLLYWFDTGVDFTSHPAAAYSLASGIAFFFVLVPTARAVANSKSKRELRAGYTTLPYLTDVDLRDPKDGRLLRSEGAYGADGKFTLSLKRARIYADEVQRGLWR